MEEFSIYKNIMILLFFGILVGAVFNPPEDTVNIRKYEKTVKEER